MQLDDISVGQHTRQAVLVPAEHHHLDPLLEILLLLGGGVHEEDITIKVCSSRFPSG